MAKEETPVQEPDTPPHEPDTSAMSDFDVFATWVPEETPINMVPSQWTNAVAKARSARRDDADKGDADEAAAAIKELFPDAPKADLAKLLKPPTDEPAPKPSEKPDKKPAA
jgi:hypothetical protein